MVADVTVVGAGIIALSAALELADRGATVRLVGTTHSGNASAAAGGMLAPSVGSESGAAHTFAVASRDFFPGYAASLAARARRPVPMNMAGTLELALAEHEASMLRNSNDRSGRWLSAEEVAIEEPALALSRGAFLHPLDVAVEPLALLDALRIVVADHDGITAAVEDCRAVQSTESGCSVLTDMESRFTSDHVVVAAGAWTPIITGLDQSLASVQPVRGQMMAFESTALRRVVYGAGGYLIPRSNGIVVAGGTTEHAGFDVGTTAAGLESIRSRALRLCPALSNAPIQSTWSGLRPMTPDSRPIIGPDPSQPRVVYACGHSRNGILLAPLTAQVVADLVLGATPRYDLSQYRPGRH